MDSFVCKTLTLFVLYVSLQEGRGLPLSHGAEPSAQAPHPHHVRTKRCSCNNWDDKECIYFCHLDIIWVNTPSKLLPYGLGSFLSRGRRSADRCRCLSPDDETCSSFCYKSTDGTGPVTESAKTPSNKLLSSLRSVVKSNVATAKDLWLEQNSANRTRR